MSEEEKSNTKMDIIKNRFTAYLNNYTKEKTELIVAGLIHILDELEQSNQSTTQATSEHQEAETESETEADKHEDTIQIMPIVVPVVKLFYSIYFIKLRYVNTSYLYVTIAADGREANAKRGFSRAIVAAGGQFNSTNYSFEQEIRLISKTDKTTILRSQSLQFFVGKKNHDTGLITNCLSVADLKNNLPNNFYTLREFTDEYGLDYSVKFREDFPQPIGGVVTIYL